jgi:hypothetical protein
MSNLSGQLRPSTDNDAAARALDNGIKLVLAAAASASPVFNQAQFSPAYNGKKKQACSLIDPYLKPW